MPSAFGSVYLARERPNQDTNPEDLRHYAVKVEKHITLLGAKHAGFMELPMVPMPDNAESPTHLPLKAMVLLLTKSDRFPKFDSVYTHDCFQAIVMSPCIDYAPDREPIQRDDLEEYISL